MEELTKIFTLPRLFVALAVVVITVALWIAISTAMNKALKGDKPERKTHIRVICRILRVVLVFVALLIILQTFGVNVTSALAGLGLLSVIVGLALQDLLKDLIMGMYVLTQHFYAEGEYVEYQGREGRILKFSLLTTKIGDIDDHSVFTVCNRNISEIRRLSHRMLMDVPLSYADDPEKVDRLMEDVCAAIKENELVEDAVFLGTQAFESSDILYRVRLLCSPENRPAVRYASLRGVQNALKKHGMCIPFNQLDVHFDSPEAVRSK